MLSKRVVLGRVGSIGFVQGKERDPQKRNIFLDVKKYLEAMNFDEEWWEFFKNLAPMHFTITVEMFTAQNYKVVVEVHFGEFTAPLITIVKIYGRNYLAEIEEELRADLAVLKEQGYTGK